MSYYRENRTNMTTEVASQSAMSEVNAYHDSMNFASPRGLSDGFSLEDVFAAMMKDLHDLFEKVSAFETELDHFSKRGNPRRSKSYNSRESNEYKEILKKKGDLLEKITASIEKMVLSPEIPKTKIHCYQKYAALLQNRCDNIRQNINMLMDDVRKTNQECKRVKEKVETFKNLIEDEESTNERDETNRLFNEARTDLNALLAVIYPDNIKDEFMNAMAHLTEAFMKNNDKEDQYVELSPETLQNNGILCLIKSFVIIENPSNPSRYRLNMAE